MNDPTPRAIAEALVASVAELTEPLRLIPRTTGRSGAQSYEVVSDTRRFMLKLDAPGRPRARWQESLRIQQAAAGRGATPAVLAWDETARAILSDHVQDTSFLRAVFDPNQSDAVLAGLAESVAALHAVPPQTFTTHTSPLQQCRETLTRVAARFDVPEFAARTWRDLLQRKPITNQDATCHLDLNPSNILFDGAKVWLVDWDTAGPGDRWLDIATVSNMLLFDDDRSQSWIRHYAESAGVPPPNRAVFAEARRVSYVGYGCAFLDLVTAPPAQALDQHSLATCYAAMQRGELDMDTDAGRWQLAAAYFAGYWDVT